MKPQIGPMTPEKRTINREEQCQPSKGNGGGGSRRGSPSHQHRKRTQRMVTQRREEKNKFSRGMGSRKRECLVRSSLFPPDCPLRNNNAVERHPVVLTNRRARERSRRHERGSSLKRDLGPSISEVVKHRPSVR